MARKRRPLSMELFEERTLPSATLMPDRPEFSPRAAKVSHTETQGEKVVIPVFTVWTGLLVTGDGSVYRVRAIFETNLIVSFDTRAALRDMQSGGRTAPEVKSPPRAGTTDFPSESEVRSHSPNPARAASASTPAAAAAVVPPPDPTPPGRADGSTQAATAAAAPQAVAGADGVPAAALLSGQFISMSTAGRVFGGEAMDVADDAPPPVIPLAETHEPPIAPPVPPEEPPVELAADVLAPAVLPIAGVFPVDLNTLSACATNLLGRVGDLDAALPDDMPGIADYAWTAAAVLLAGGAIYSATGDRNARSSRRLAEAGSALAEWEGKNVGRPY